MGVHENWAEYVQRITAGVPQKGIAKATGIDQTGISRWIRGLTTVPRAEKVVAFARGMGADPVEALVAAGYLDPAEVGAVEVTASAAALSDDALLDEVRIRLRRNSQRPGGFAPNLTHTPL